MPEERPLSRGEEVANTLTHGVGLVASVIGFPFLVLPAVARGNPGLVAGCAVFAAALVALYLASTIYHLLPPSPAKRLFRVVDHIAIYLLIAGTYTPFLLGVMGGAWGWTLFWVVWSLAGLGILCKLVPRARYSVWTTVLYLGMGWLAVVALGPLRAALPGAGVAWLVAGGLLYTVGVGFYAWERARYAHAVWHLFVLGGSACHFWAVVGYALA